MSFCFSALLPFCSSCKTGACRAPRAVQGRSQPRSWHCSAYKCLWRKEYQWNRQRHLLTLQATPGVQTSVCLWKSWELKEQCKHRPINERRHTPTAWVCRRSSSWLKASGYCPKEIPRCAISSSYVQWGLSHTNGVLYIFCVFVLVKWGREGLFTKITLLT